MSATTLLSVLVPLAQASPWFAAAYLCFVLGLGPRLMRDREPLRPKLVLAAYNALQVAISASLFYKSFALCLDRRYDVMCPRAQPPLDVVMGDPEAHAFELEVTRVVYYQGSLRVLDLADTVFLVLAKKTSQLTFLHIYHHFSVVLYSWIAITSDSGAGTTFLPASINNFVHAIMYAYYLLALFGIQFVRSWRKYITQLQIFQFMLVILYILQAIFRKDCDTPLLIIRLTLAQFVVFLCLFLHFYIRAYNKKKDA